MLCPKHNHPETGLNIAPSEKMKLILPYFSPAYAVTTIFFEPYKRIGALLSFQAFHRYPRGETVAMHTTNKEGPHDHKVLVQKN